MNLDIAVEQAGRNPWLVGLATIGGVLALCLLAVRFAVLLYKARNYLNGSIKGLKRALLRHDYRQLQLARLVKRVRLSDLFLIRPAIDDVADKIKGLTTDCLVIGLGWFLYGLGVEELGRGVIGGGVFAAAFDGYGLASAVRRISWLLEAGNFPSRVLKQLSSRRRKLKR